MDVASWMSHRGCRTVAARAVNGHKREQNAAQHFRIWCVTEFEVPAFIWSFPGFIKCVDKNCAHVPVSAHREQSVKREKNQQDATIRCLLSTSVSTCFGHHYAHLQENKDRVLLQMVYRAGSAACGW